MPCKDDVDEYNFDTISYDSDDQIYIKAEEHNISQMDWYDEMKPAMQEIYEFILQYRDNSPMFEHITFAKLVKFIAENSSRGL